MTPHEQQAIGATFRRERMRHDYTATELARRAGYSLAVVSALETGRVVPSFAALCCLATALHCHVELIQRQEPGGVERVMVKLVEE